MLFTCVSHLIGEIRENFFKDIAFELGVEELQRFIRIVYEAAGWSLGSSLQRSARYFQCNVSGSILLEHLMNLASSSRQRGWKGSRGQVAPLNSGRLPLQDRGSCVSCVVFRAPFLLLHFVWEHIFFFFLFLWLNHTSQGHRAFSDCSCNSLSTSWDLCIKQLSGATQASRKLEVLL